jgi:hypothetical protein
VAAKSSPAALAVLFLEECFPPTFLNIVYLALKPM